MLDGVDCIPMSFVVSLMMTPITRVYDEKNRIFGYFCRLHVDAIGLFRRCSKLLYESCANKVINGEFINWEYE